MYHALLTNRYLTSRLIPLIAVAAVALCVALVIIVVSVMSGFLEMVRSSGRTLMGDVVISYPVSGIPHYEQLIERIERLPEAAAAAPVVDGLGLLKMPYPEGPEKQTEIVQFWGVDERFAKVTGYKDTIYWKKLTKEQWTHLFSDLVTRRWKELLATLNEQERIALIRGLLDTDKPDGYTPPPDEIIRQDMLAMSDREWERLFAIAGRYEPKVIQNVLGEARWTAFLQNDPRLLDDDLLYEQGLKLQWSAGSDAVASLGMHVSEGNIRNKKGQYQAAGLGRWWMPRFEVTLTTLPVRESSVSRENAESRVLQVVNEFVSGVFLIDDRRMMVPLRIAQEMLHLDEGERVDANMNVIGSDPARATMVLVRANDAYTPDDLREAVIRTYDDFWREIEEGSSLVKAPPRDFGLSINTWVQQQAQFIGPVEKEREMMRTLFSLVYIVCAGLVLAIFWAIVYEKTRDIGILRSVGASRLGISWIFLRYGLVVGVLGGLAGLALGYLIVRKINTIHEALGNPPLWLAVVILSIAGIALIATVVKAISGRFLPVVVGGLLCTLLTIVGLLALWLWKIGGFVMWDPSVYYFAQIPNDLDVNNAIITVIGAVVFSVVGALLPAAKAADTDPVQALRYE